MSGSSSIGGGTDPAPDIRYSRDECLELCALSRQADRADGLLEARTLFTVNHMVGLPVEDTYAEITRRLEELDETPPETVAQTVAKEEGK